MVGAGSRSPQSNGFSAATEGQTALGGLTGQLLPSIFSTQVVIIY